MVARLIVAQAEGFKSPRHPKGPVVSMASTQDLQSCSEGSTPSWFHQFRGSITGNALDC